jgi:membrane protease YdiL (CAAX protease family)
MKMPGVLWLGVAYMFMPMTSALVVQKLLYKAPLKEPLRINYRPNRWFLAAWLLPPFIALATLGVSLLIPGVTFSQAKADTLRGFLTPEQLNIRIHPFWLEVFQALFLGITVNTVAAFGEELGWRGFLQRELAPLGFWKASAAIGVVWGFWHAPLIIRGFNYPQHPWAGVFLMTVLTVLLSPVLGYITLKAKSVLAAAILHGTFNASALLATVGLEGGNDLLLGLSGLAGVAVLLIANLAIFFFDRRFAVEPIV